VSLACPQDTLAYFQSRVLTQQRDMRQTPLHHTTAKLQAFMQSDTSPSTIPETEALWFYGMNHGVALITQKRHPLEPLPEFERDFMKEYHKVLVPKAVRAFYYLLLICTREARHNQSLKKDGPKMAALFGPAVAQFFTSINGGEQGIHSALIKNPPKVGIGAFCEALRWQFYNSTWSHGFGGKAWGGVTDCLCRFVNGEFSAEMMLDTNWTLCHNNGPIFNKGMLYGHYNGIAIARILDVQRSGQTPEQILADKTVKHYVDPLLAEWMKQLSEYFPGKIGKYIDWYVVEALGANQSYPNEKKVQVAEYGMSPKASEAEKLAEAKAKAAKEAAAKKAKEAAELKAKQEKEKAEKYFTVMPGLELEKIKRAA
jgi:hypothetical protein